MIAIPTLFVLLCIVRNLLGLTFGRLIVINRAPNRGVKKRAFWECRCECGQIKSIRGEHLTSGRVVSCGCYIARITGERSQTHGATRNRRPTREYRAWSNAKTRCFDPRYKFFAAYGGRGITMCPQWVNDFARFASDMGPCPPGMSLDRTEVNGHYEPGNCRWATAKKQANNTRRNRLIVFDGACMTLQQLADMTGLSYKALHKRILYRNQSPEVAVSGVRVRAIRAKPSPSMSG